MSELMMSSPHYLPYNLYMKFGNFNILLVIVCPSYQEHYSASIQRGIKASLQELVTSLRQAYRSLIATSLRLQELVTSLQQAYRSLIATSLRQAYRSLRRACDELAASSQHACDYSIFLPPDWLKKLPNLHFWNHASSRQARDELALSSRQACGELGVSPDWLKLITLSQAWAASSSKLVASLNIFL